MVAKMRILLCSHWFFPSVGGVETISKILAEEFVRAGATVTVVTNTPGPEMDVSYTVMRRPSHKTLRLLARESDVIFQNLISLRTLVSLILSRKPIVVTHQSWLRRTDGKRGLENYTKLLALRACHNVSISKAIAASLPVRSIVIGNPFEAKAFEGLLDTPHDKDIVFLGRLVSDKGCDLLLHALAELKAKNLFPSLTVIGDGPEMPTLQALTDQLGLRGQVEFLGALQEGRGEIVARHHIMAIPSIWAEPFGVVALEGVASGCAIVASSRGGLPDAGGPCGLYFPNGDVKALASALGQMLTNVPLRKELAANGPAHLKGFQPAVIAGHYLELFRSVVPS
ncbi:MAG: glycosyl transferase group 1 [Acidobacteriaceae bacterium]|nr:glycosyl transferase group 1 [Acidobacteriaceae bacterium]